MTLNLRLIRNAVFVIAGLSWGYTLGHIGAFTSSTWLGWTVLGCSAIFTFIYLKYLCASERLKNSVMEKNEELESVRSAVDEHCLISIVDAQRKMTFVNDSVIAATGFSRQELLGKDPVGFEVELNQAQNEEIARCKTAGQKWSGEIKIERKDGSVLWTHSTITPRYSKTGQFLGSISVRTDITATKVAVAEREAISIIHKMNDNVYIFEPETYRFTYMNEAGMRRLKWDRDTYVSKSVLDSDKNLDRVRLDALVAPLLEGKLEQIQVTVQLDDGPHEITIQLIHTENDRVSFVAVFRNIADKLEMGRIKDEFISTVSHELRSPITSIKGALSLLMASTNADLPPQFDKLLNIANRNADRLVLIVNDILDLEKIAAGSMKLDFQPMDICDVVQEAIQINTGIEKRFEVEVRSEGFDQPAPVQVDSNRMIQVLTNLLSNAAKFSNTGGKILVSLGRDDNNFVVNVRDYGVGIKEIHLDSIFNRFGQADNHTERSGRGTGLGLSIVKAIMDQHGGSISVESKPGCGSTFSLRLPIDHTVQIGNHQFAKEG